LNDPAKAWTGQRLSLAVAKLKTAQSLIQFAGVFDRDESSVCNSQKGIVTGLSRLSHFVVTGLSSSVARAKKPGG